MINIIYFWATLRRRFSKKECEISIGFNSTLMWRIFPITSGSKLISTQVLYRPNGSTKMSTEQSLHLKFSNIQKSRIPSISDAKLKRRRYNLKKSFYSIVKSNKLPKWIFIRSVRFKWQRASEERLNLISILGFCRENNQENCFANSSTSTAELFSLAIELLPPDSS